MQKVRVCGQCSEPLGVAEYGCPDDKCDLVLCGTCSNWEVHFPPDGICPLWWGKFLTEKEVDERMQEAALKHGIRVFADVLAEAGYTGAEELIQDELLPLAKEKQISLLGAALEYANQDEEQDTSWFQLSHTLQKIPDSVIQDINIHEVL